MSSETTAPYAGREELLRRYFPKGTKQKPGPNLVQFEKFLVKTRFFAVNPKFEHVRQKQSRTGALSKNRKLADQLEISRSCLSNYLRHAKNAGLIYMHKGQGRNRGINWTRRGEYFWAAYLMCPDVTDGPFFKGVTRLQICEQIFPNLASDDFFSRPAYTPSPPNLPDSQPGLHGNVPGLEGLIAPSYPQSIPEAEKKKDPQIDRLFEAMKHMQAQMDFLKSELQKTKRELEEARGTKTTTPAVGPAERIEPPEETEQSPVPLNALEELIECAQEQTERATGKRLPDEAIDREKEARRRKELLERGFDDERIRPALIAFGDARYHKVWFAKSGPVLLSRMTDRVLQDILLPDEKSGIRSQWQINEDLARDRRPAPPAVESQAGGPEQFGAVPVPEICLNPGWPELVRYLQERISPGSLTMIQEAFREEKNGELVFSGDLPEYLQTLLISACPRVIFEPVEEPETAKGAFWKPGTAGEKAAPNQSRTPDLQLVGQARATGGGQASERIPAAPLEGLP